MSRTRRRLVAAAAALTCAGLGTVAVGFFGFGPLDRPAVTETRLEPQRVSVLGQGGDPLVLMVGVTWTEEGYCDGQFEVHATESATEVRIGTVVSREEPGMLCAGLGTAGNTAWTSVYLAAPLGERQAVRESDGFVLPVRKLS